MMEFNIYKPMIDLMDEYDVFIFEGFEMTGKTYMIDQMSKEMFDLDYYPYQDKVDWSVIYSDKILKRGNRYILGLRDIDNFGYNHADHEKMLLDRSIASSYVYQQFYAQDHDYDSFDDVVESFNNIINKNNIKVLFIYKYHYSIKDAKTIYNKSNSDSNHEDKYDKFSSFEDYYRTYCKFHRLFFDFFHRYGFKYIKVKSTQGDII